MSDIVILRAALEALDRADHQKADPVRPAGRKPDWNAGASGPLGGRSAEQSASDVQTAAERAALVPEFVQDRRFETRDIDDHAVYFDDDLDSESVRLLALKAQQQLSIQALAIANVRALSIIGLFRDDEPPMRLM